MSDTEVKGLAYYQDHPHELGNLSDAELDRLASQGDTVASTESGQPPAAAGATQDQLVDPKVNPEPEPPKADEPVPAKTEVADPAATDKPAEAQPEGVATKDGQRIIPYQVLANERQRANDLERVAREQADRIRQLEEGQKAKPDAKDGQEAVPVLSEEELADLEKELPALGKLFRTQQAQLQAFGQTVQTLTEERQARHDEGARTLQQTVQEAIDSNPKLAFLQSQDPAMWGRAVRFDNTLREDSEWAGKTYAERFEKVVQLYEATYGEVQLPGQPSPTPSAQPQPSQADLAKQADAKLKNKEAVPTSLSAIPGGLTPAADDVVGALSSKSGAELTSHFMGMTPAQIEATLNRLS